jgi:hypothetical protein
MRTHHLPPSVIFAGALLLLGCSGSSSPVLPGPDAEVGDASPPGNDTASPDDAIAEPPVMPTPDGAPADSSAPDNRIDPIALGRSWTYDVQVFGTTPVCDGGQHTGAVLGESMVLGKQAFQIQSFCPAAGTSYYAVDGDVVDVDYQGQWVLALDAPVQEGHTWSNGVATFTWHSAGSVTVPAGTFGDCWNATESVSYTAYTLFCRGVGPVRWYSKDLAGSGFDAQLTAKSF